MWATRKPRKHHFGTAHYDVIFQGGWPHVSSQVTPGSAQWTLCSDRD